MPMRAQLTPNAAAYKSKYMNGAVSGDPKTMMADFSKLKPEDHRSFRRVAADDLRGKAEQASRSSDPMQQGWGREMLSNLDKGILPGGSASSGVKIETGELVAPMGARPWSNTGNVNNGMMMGGGMVGSAGWGAK